MTPLARFRAFEERFARSQATAVIEYGWGYGLRQTDYPASWHHNRLVVTDAVPVATVLVAADELLADVAHRTVHVEVDTPGLVEEFAAAGYADHERIVPMLFTGQPPDPAPNVVEVTECELRAVLAAEWRSELLDATAEEIAQLADRIALYGLGAEVTFLGVRAGGEIVAHADLYAADGVSQLENLVTRPAYQRRGYARALVAEALARSPRACYLTAEATSWAYRWYGAQGFREIGVTHQFQRS